MTWRQHVCTSILLVGFAAFGVAARIGLDKLAQLLHMYSWQTGSSYQSVLSNCVGCLLLGGLAQLRAKFGWFQRAASAQLYLCLSTGLCGSLTTFSGWLYASSWVLTNGVDGRPVVEHVVDSIGVLVVGYALSAVFFRFGQQVFDAVPCCLSPTDNDNSDDDSRLFLFGSHSNGAMVLLALLLAAVLAAPIACLVLVAEARAVCLSIVLGPMGALARWQLAVQLNKRCERFPIGTFAANLSGTVLYCLCQVAMGLAIAGGQSSVLPSNSALLSDVGWLFLEATLTGVCGALTTMSTFVYENEVALAAPFAYRYLFVSVAASYAALLLINGLYFWMADQPSVVPLS